MKTLDVIVLRLPSANEEHYPLIIKVRGTDSELTVYGAVRTDSFYWDGAGGRTDLHDVF